MSETNQAPDAIIIGPASSYRINLATLLRTLGMENVLLLDSPEESRHISLIAACRLMFVSWETWSVPGMEWLARDEPVGGTLSGPKVFLIVPNDHSIDLVGAIKSGIDGYITFPYSLHNLRQKIQSVLPALVIRDPRTKPPRTSSRSL